MSSTRVVQGAFVVITADTERELAETEADFLVRAHVEGRDLELVDAPHQRVYAIMARNVVLDHGTNHNS